MSRIYPSKATRAFTLIELLVAISIISLLSSITLTALRTTKISGEESTRIRNLNSIIVALELYRDTHGEYPPTFSPGDSVTPRHQCFGYEEDYIPDLAPENMRQLPGDPKENCDGPTYSWSYASDGVDYKIVTHPEQESDAYMQYRDPAEDGGSDPCIQDGPLQIHFGAWTSGGACWTI